MKAVASVLYREQCIVSFCTSLLEPTKPLLVCSLKNIKLYLAKGEIVAFGFAKSCTVQESFKGVKEGNGRVGGLSLKLFFYGGVEVSSNFRQRTRS